MVYCATGQAVPRELSAMIRSTSLIASTTLGVTPDGQEIG